MPWMGLVEMQFSSPWVSVLGTSVVSLIELDSSRVGGRGGIGKWFWGWIMQGKRQSQDLVEGWAQGGGGYIHNKIVLAIKSKDDRAYLLDGRGLLFEKGF